MTLGALDRLVVIADTHMAAGRHDAFAADDHVASFLASLARGPQTQLLVLGDLIDFALVEADGGRVGRLDTHAAGATRKLAEVARAHKAVFEQLRELLAAGGRVDVVPGNHDLELLLPPVWDAFSRLVTPEAGRGPTLRPWIFHVPGLVFAEHGHQHHEVSRVPDLLTLDRRDAAPLPLGTALSEFGIARREAGTRRAAAACAANVRRALRERGAGRETQPAIADEARQLGIEPAALAAVHALGPDGGAHAIARAAVRVARERLSPGSTTPYMRRAARRAHHALAAHGHAVRFYLTGHTHVAADVPLDDGARYLNPGTWSTLRAAGAPQGYSYVEITRGGGARLSAWTR